MAVRRPQPQSIFRGTVGCRTLTRLAALGALSRNAGEGEPSAKRQVDGGPSRLSQIARTSPSPMLRRLPGALLLPYRFGGMVIYAALSAASAGRSRSWVWSAPSG